MLIVPSAIELIKRNEGLRLEAYLDVAGIPTIGYGHTPSRIGQTITEAEATAMLMADLSHASDAVAAAAAGVETTDNQFSAMVSLTFNIGSGAFKGSTVLRMHRAGDYLAAANAFLLWDKAHINGKLVTVAGLHRRRIEEQGIYLANSPMIAAAPSAPLSTADTGRSTSDADAVEAVKTLQRILIDLRRYKGKVDGILGDQTKAGAMAAYNASHLG